MKKTLSLILAILLTFSMASFAFAEEAASITKDQAKELARQHLTYNTVILEYAVEDGQVYTVVSNLRLNSSRIIEFTSTVDKFSGKICSQSADFKDPLAILTKNISIEKAYALAIEALGLNEANLSVLTEEAVTTENGKDAYHFIFCEGYYKTYECTVMKSDGFIDDIKVEEPTNIIQRLILTIKVLISKINVTNILENISAADLLKIFQFFSK